MTIWKGVLDAEAVKPGVMDPEVNKWGVLDFELVAGAPVGAGLVPRDLPHTPAYQSFIAT